MATCKQCFTALLLAGVEEHPDCSLIVQRVTEEEEEDRMKDSESKKRQYEELLHMEVERMLVKENALAVASNLLEHMESEDSHNKWHKLSKVLLSEYVLDFGYVIPGQVLTQTLDVTNTGPVPASFNANVKRLAGTGFSVEFEKVKNLPCGESQTFTVKFDPQGANVKMGHTTVVMPIQVTFGPRLQVQLSATVTEPAVTVSTDTLQFDTVQCGMCQIKTVQLINHERVPCHWSMAEEVKPFKKVDRFLPLHLRKKVMQQQRPPPAVFEMTPSFGMLSPSEQVNVHIQFSPEEGMVYSRRLVVCVADSTRQIFLTAHGQGEEPQLEFCPSVLEVGPCLPASTEVEAEITVKNPCSFPIEFYSLELDTQYLEEEKILRVMQGYDEKNKLLLPPVHPGDGLPKELLEYYEEYCSKLKTGGIDDGKDRGIHAQSAKVSDSLKYNHEAEISVLTKVLSEISTEEFSGRLAQLATSPVTRANLRHMCIDLSPEGLAARNCRGIAIIVYGAPLTDKNSIAGALTHLYEGVCICIDAVVTDVLINGTSPVSLAARELYEFAVAEYAQRKMEEAAQSAEETARHAEDHEVADLTPKSVLSSVDPGRVVAVPSYDSSNLSPTHQEATKTCFTLSLGGDVTTLRDILPEQLLADILAERFQLSDCYRGIVINGLDSVYTSSTAAALQVVLKALNNRKHIYVVNLSDTYDTLKARETAQRETEEALQKEKADREVEWLKSLDDEQFDSLPEEVKAHILQQHVKKLRQQKLSAAQSPKGATRGELEKKLKEEEKTKQEQKIKRLREDELKKKGKKGAKKDAKEVSRRRSVIEGKESADAMTMSPHSNFKESPEDTGVQSALIDAPVHPIKEADDLQKHTEETKASHAVSHQLTDNLASRKSSPTVQASVDELHSLFIEYEKRREQVEHILHYWDRTQSLLLVPLPGEESPLETNEASTQKQRSQTPAAKKNKKATEKSPEPCQTVLSPTEIERIDVIPHIVLNVTGKEHQSVAELLKDSSLPSVDQILDDLGIGPSGPPVPPSTLFSMALFPKKRRDDIGKLSCDCFTFLVPLRPGKQVEKEKYSEEELQIPAVKVAPSKNRGKGSAKESTMSKEPDKKGRESRNKRRPTLRASCTTDCNEATTQDQHQSTLELKRSQSLTRFRWTVPANGKLFLKIWFYSDSPGTFTQTFNFELLGTKKLYQLQCRGISTYPSICKDYMTLFPTCKKVQHMQKEIQKAYVIKPGYFEFGPLLCGKTRDKCNENSYPENTEKVVIHNNSGLEAEVQFRFQQDTHAATFLLDPPAMTLKPDQKQELTVWAYPTRVGQMKDRIVCSVRDNPDGLVIDLSCWGVRPELKLEGKHFHFDRIMLHRRDSRSVMLHNKTALPVSWKLHGVEELGDEFCVPQDQGIIAPNSSWPLSLHFKARRPLNVKKTVRLEVSDVEKILGIVHTENLPVTAEAYDVALEISPEGCLDFGTIKVFDESKLILKIKNQGKYEIAYKFIIQQTNPSLPNLGSIFSMSPQSGTLRPHEKPTTVHIVCRPNKKFSFKEQPVLSCQVIEPNLGDGGETIAILAINVSVTSVFSRYKITPSCDLNFGPLAYGGKKSLTFTIENRGLFDTRFTIGRVMTPERPRGPGNKMPQDSQSERSTATVVKLPRESIHKEPRCTQNLNMGVFSVAPCTGSLHPGALQVVTVTCVAEQLGIWKQGLLIDVSDRDPSDHPNGIPYTLMAEVCRPSIVLDIVSIFEEHRVCRKSSQLAAEEFCNVESIYVEEENRFIFNKTLVGATAQASVKFTNNSKVPCVLTLVIRNACTKVFELSASTFNIPSQSHTFAVVTFTPQMMQFYNAVFEATLETSSRMTSTSKSKVLEFHLTGEGILPSVSVLHPTVRSSTGSPLLHFRRVLVGQRHALPLILINDGYLPAQVNIDLMDSHGVFTLKAAPGNSRRSILFTPLEVTTDSEHQLVHRAMLSLDVNEEVELEVFFCSDKPLVVKTTVSVQVADNKYSTTTIHVSGEAYHEIISLYNINKSSQEIDLEDDGGNCEMLNFGGCWVDCPYQQSLMITNHSSSQVFRFEWPPAGPQVSFSPQVGHLHAGCSKEVTITFCSSEPVTLRNERMRCRVTEVVFEQPIEEVADWDDRQRKCLSSSVQSLESPEQQAKRTDDLEPPCSVVEGSQLELSLCISAVCDFVKFRCNTDTVHFEDTMLYQTRLQQLQIVNHGVVKLEFSFQLLMDPCGNNREGSRLAVVLTEARPSPFPISIEPSMGTIEPGQMQNFNIHFSPVEVAQYQCRLVGSIPSLQDRAQAPSIVVCGRSLLPNCHFDLDDSDCISRFKSDPEFTGRLDPDTRILEFSSIGLLPSTRCFNVLNPTKTPYSFEWKCEDAGGSPFHCLTPTGTILPGKKVQACFEFATEEMRLVRSSWSFVIETLSLSVPLMCVGSTREPCFYLSKPQIDFGELLVGRKVEQTVDLVSGEEEPFHFSVIQSSLLCNDQQSRLSLKPMTGVVAPKDRLPLSVTFTPCCEGYKSFRLVLKVKKKSEPLALTVKASCSIMSANVQVKMPHGGLREINPNQQDTVDFGEVEISKQSIFDFLLTNQSTFSMEVNFELKASSKLLQYLEARPQNATIDAGGQLQSSLSFSPKSICTLEDVSLRIKIKLGPTFSFAVKGRSAVPRLEFSFTKYNFGKCFLYRPGMLPSSHSLVIRNTGNRDISVQCQFRNTPYLEMDFRTDILSAGALLEVPFRFLPQEVCDYHEKVTFIFNRCITKQVEILGQGVKMKLEVEDPKQKKLNLGFLNLGQKLRKQVKLVNRSAIDLSFKLLLNTQLDPRDLLVNPVEKLYLRANGGLCHVDIMFSPRQRIPAFTAELQAECAGLVHTLLTIQGCCQVLEVQLDQNHLAFGAVVQNCQARKKVVMMNTGDVGARFQWKTNSFPPDLSITPAKGFIRPGMEVPFYVTFAPIQLAEDIRYENVSCCVVGSSSPVTLTVTGSCTAASSGKEVVNFVCPVRSSHTQMLHVANPTNQQCRIKPIIKGEHWRAASFMTLEPLQNKIYEMTYQPMIMTVDGKKHQGSVFFPFPDGTGMQYSLQGTAESPKAEDVIVHQLPAKTLYTMALPVHNWLAKKQQFRVLLEIQKHDKPDATVSLKGLPFIDVPALATKDYKLSFFTYREGQYQAKVTFHDVTSGEYLFYHVVFEATPPGAVSTIELVANVRQKASATVQVENPLSTATCLTLECKCLEISAPSQHTVPGNSKGSVSIEYQPLHAGESTARLTLFSHDLGQFHYDLLLRALPPPPEKTVHFSTFLGSSHCVVVKFVNYSQVKTEYSYTIDCSDFTVDKPVNATPGYKEGSEASVSICFEPHRLGEVNGRLCLSSPTGGKYTFLLHGVCVPPKVQGPFIIRHGRSLNIPFKNVFQQTTTFSFQVDNPCLTVKGFNTTIDSKKTQNISVFFEVPSGGSQQLWFGKLTISTQCSDSHNKPFSWVYYLQGSYPE